MKKERRATRSDAYQHLYNEVLCNDASWLMFDSSESYTSTLNPWKYDEYVLAWEDQLKERIWDIIDVHMTNKQKEVLRLVYKDGYTQWEAADIRGVNQSSITKAIHGNTTYTAEGKNEYGGCMKKLRIIIAEDTICQELMSKIKERRQDNY